MAIELAGAAAIIQGNTIGLNASGAPLPNGRGIDVSSASQAIVGGAAANAPNTIAFNNGKGVSVDGGANLAAIQRNQIFGNSGGVSCSAARSPARALRRVGLRTTICPAPSSHLRASHRGTWPRSTARPCGAAAPAPTAPSRCTRPAQAATTSAAPLYWEAASATWARRISRARAARLRPAPPGA